MALSARASYAKETKGPATPVDPRYSRIGKPDFSRIQWIFDRSNRAHSWFADQSLLPWLAAEVEPTSRGPVRSRHQMLVVSILGSFGEIDSKLGRKSKWNLPCHLVRAGSRFRCSSRCWSSFVFILHSHAQQTTASISGTVKDPSGAVLPQASVTATNASTGAVERTTADASWRVYIPYSSVR